MSKEKIPLNSHKLLKKLLTPTIWKIRNYFLGNPIYQGSQQMIIFQFLNSSN